MLALRNTTNFWGGDRSLPCPGESENYYVAVGVGKEEADDVWEEEENNEEERLPELNDADDDDYEYEDGRMSSGGGGKRKGHKKDKSGGMGIYSSRHVRGQIQRLANATKAVVSAPKGKKSEGVSFAKTGAWLGMYDFDFPLREANDVLWSALRSCLVANGADPGHLPGVHIDRESDMVGVWTNPDLFLAHTCGYPYVTLLKEKRVRVVATPVYDAPLCESTDHHYRSVVVVRRDSPHQSLEGLRGLRAAVNSLDSNSGMNAFRHLLAQLVHQKNESDASVQASFFSEVKLSGGHLRSVAMVEEGEVDVAAIDCVTFSILKDMRPNLPVRVLAKTEVSPGLPLITSARTSAGDVAVLQSCLVELFSRHDDEDDADFNVLEWQLPGAPAEPRDDDGGAAQARDKLKRAKEVLRIKGIKVWANDEEADRAYQKILDMEDEAKAMNYPELK